MNKYLANHPLCVNNELQKREWCVRPDFVCGTNIDEAAGAAQMINCIFIKYVISDKIYVNWNL